MGEVVRTVTRSVRAIKKAWSWADLVYFIERVGQVFVAIVIMAMFIGSVLGILGLPIIVIVIFAQAGIKYFGLLIEIPLAVVGVIIIAGGIGLAVNFLIAIWREGAW